MSFQKIQEELQADSSNNTIQFLRQGQLFDLNISYIRETANNNTMLGELTKEEIEDLLTSTVIGRIGCCAQQKMYVVPVTYMYDGEFILGHTVEGMKINLLRQNPECCFEVDEIKDIANWQSVIAHGTFEELKGEDAEIAIGKLMRKLSPLIPSETSQPPRMGPDSTMRTHTQLNNPIIYRIKLKEKSGRYERP